MRMSTTLLQLCGMYLSVGPITFYMIAASVLLLPVAVLGSWAWVTAKERMERTRCRDWPKVPAVIDIVSVAYCKPDSVVYIKPSSYNPYYRATLTYTYHYPDEQMGDYSRDFGMSKENAESWANSYKGETVNVRVNPDDPTDSILLEEEL